jgi:hypothetical protein
MRDGKWSAANEDRVSQRMEEIVSYIGTEFRDQRNPDDPIANRDAECFFKDLESPSYEPDENRRTVQRDWPVNFSSIAVRIVYSLGIHRANNIKMPYFSSSTIDALGTRATEYRKLTTLKYCKPPERNELGVQLPSTLDEYCNPNLDPRVLDIRNKDQVLVRHEREKAQQRGKQFDLQSTRILTVPQIWIWNIGNQLFTAAPAEFLEVLNMKKVENDWRPSRVEQYLEICESWVNAVEKEKVSIGRGMEPSKDLFVGLLLCHCIDLLDRPYMAGISEPVLGVFEKSISSLSEAVKSYTRSGGVSEINMSQETQFLHEISDLREELSMIKHVLYEQEEVWRDYTYEKFPDCWPNGPGDKFDIPQILANTDAARVIPVIEAAKILERPQRLFAKYSRQIAKLDADAERVEKSILTQLDLKAKHAGLKETHLTTIMSAAVIGFTIVTIIFTPLSFLASLLALPIDDLQRHQITSSDGSSSYTTNYIGKWMGEFP